MFIEVLVCPKGCGHYYAAPSIEGIDLAREPRRLKVENQHPEGYRTLGERIGVEIKMRGHRMHCPRCSDFLSGNPDDRILMVRYRLPIPVDPRKDPAPEGVAEVRNAAVVTHVHHVEQKGKEVDIPAISGRSVVVVDELRAMAADVGWEAVGDYLRAVPTE